jgi:response regulator RpfG family c-di-GMP phosphodiesterase
MKHIALVDDDEVINLVHSEVIKRIVQDVQLEIFQSGTQLLEYLKDHDEQRLDVIFLDIRMPEMDGFEVLEKIGEMNPKASQNSRLYVLSSTLDERDLNKAKSNPLVTDFIGKPLSFDVFRQLLA